MPKTVPKYVGVKFTSSHDYTAGIVYYFKNTSKLKISNYDTVIVDTRYGLQLAVVTSLHDKKDTFSSNLSRATYEFEINKSVVEVIESKIISEMQNAEKIKDLKAKLRARAKKMDEKKVFEAYAADDAEMASLLKELNKLDK